MTSPFLAPENDYRPLLGREIDAPTLRVSIVLPVFNRTGLLERTLAGLTQQSYPETLLSVYVADDGSSEDVKSVVDRFTAYLDITYLRREHSGYGAGQARNLGASAAKDADVLVFFDADCIPDRDAVEHHATWHHLADNLVVIGSRHPIDTSALSEAEIRQGAALRSVVFGTEDPGQDDWVSQDHREVLHRRTASLRHGDMAFRSLVSSNFSVRRDRFLEQSGFSNDFTRWGGEDTELGWRLWNDGVFFIDEVRAGVFHQTQEDGGDEGWRQRSRAANDGLIQSKIPHRHYRRPSSGVINERPKVSVLVYQPDTRRLDELTSQVLGQRLDDLELIVAGEGEELTSFIERRAADPRFGQADSVPDALHLSAGEFVALVHGGTGLDHRLLSRSVAALEARPSVGWIWSAYGIATASGMDIYRRRADVTALDLAWGDRFPLFGFTRRREMMKCARSGMDVADAWEWVTANLEPVAHGVPLVILPAESPDSEHRVSVSPPTSPRSQALRDLKSGGAAALVAPIRLARAMVTGRPYRNTSIQPAQPIRPAEDRRASIRYVGWTGRSNLGDEAMLQAIRDLHSWAELTTTADTADLLMLGGGTLINRGYLRHLKPLDSPRIERVAFGPGVANPDYWGSPREDPSDWVDFLESCLFVGVRGPISATILAGWGLKRDVEIIGDPALFLTPSDGIEKVEGRVVVCPAWSRGLLWGGSDEVVIDAFARLIKVMREKGHDVWALSAFPGDDRHLIDMMRRADSPDLPYLAAHEEAQPALDLLASSELVVSERLHGAVLGAAAGTVPVMVEYRPKLRDFAESIGLGDYVIRTDALQEGRLDDLVTTAYDNRFRLAAEVSDRVDEFRSLQQTKANAVKEALRA